VRSRFVLPLVLLFILARASAAQLAVGVPGLPDVAGVWDYRATVAPSGAVVASVLTLTADGKGATIQHAMDPAVSVRVIAAGGDSLVFEAGPYASTLRPGQTVTRLLVALHHKGETMTGEFEAHYATGDTVHGKSEATRRR
jgi:hypothetical protein